MHVANNTAAGIVNFSRGILSSNVLRGLRVSMMVMSSAGERTNAKSDTV